MPWTRVGVRLIPKGHSANRSLSAIEPVSATAKRKLENGEQRPAPETYPARAEISKITGQRLGSASLTRGNVAGSHAPGNITPETRLPGWGTWIRTKIDGVRVRCSTVELSRIRWKAKFGRMDVSEARKLKTLKTENSRLKMLLSLP